MRSVARAICVVDIVRRSCWDVSFPLPFFEGDGSGGGGSGFRFGSGFETMIGGGGG